MQDISTFTLLVKYYVDFGAKKGNQVSRHYIVSHEYFI